MVIAQTIIYSSYLGVGIYLILRVIGLGYLILSSADTAPTIPPSSAPLNAPPTPNRTTDAGPIIGAAAKPNAAPVAAPTPAPAAAPLRSLSPGVLWGDSTVALAPSTSPAGDLQVIRYGEIAVCTFTVPGAINCQIPKELAA